MTDVILLTPSEDLALEVLAARHRLGESVWTFETRHRATLNRLQNRGLIEIVGSPVQKTMRALLTADGKALALDPEYKAPVFKTKGSSGEHGK